MIGIYCGGKTGEKVGGGRGRLRGSCDTTKRGNMVWGKENVKDLFLDIAKDNTKRLLLYTCTLFTIVNMVKTDVAAFSETIP